MTIVEAEQRISILERNVSQLMRMAAMDRRSAARQSIAVSARRLDAEWVGLVYRYDIRDLIFRRIDDFGGRAFEATGKEDQSSPIIMFIGLDRKPLMGRYLSGEITEEQVLETLENGK